MSTIRLGRLEGFYWVAKMKGYSRAARSFPYPITQPGIYQQIRALEDETGVPLFQRVDKDRMELTPQGRMLFELVAPFYEQIDSVLQAMRGNEYAGTLRMRAAGIALPKLLPSWLKKARRKFPDIEFELLESGRQEIDGLRRGESDLVVDFAVNRDPDLVYQPVATLYPRIVVPNDFELPKRSGVMALQNRTFIAYPTGTPHYMLQQQALQHFGVTPAKMITASSRASILGLIAAGLGGSIIVTLEKQPARLPGVKILSMPKMGPALALYAICRQDDTSPLLRAVLSVAPK